MIERLFWESRGITTQEIVYLEIIYALIIVLFEVQIGVWRRRLIQAGVALEWLSFWILLYSFTFSGFCVATSCSSIGSVI